MLFINENKTLKYKITANKKIVKNKDKFNCIYL